MSASGDGPLAGRAEDTRSRVINRVAGFRDRRALLLPIATVGMAVGLDMSNAPAQDVKQIAGCYELSIEGRLPLPMPPRQVELLVEVGTELLEQGRRLVRPKGGADGRGILRVFVVASPPVGDC